MSDASTNRRTVTLHHTAQRTMTVQGVGVATLAPDIARFDVGLREEGRQVRAIQQSVARRTETVLSAIKRHSIAERDLQTTEYTISPEYDYRDGTQSFRGYAVSTAIRVTVRAVGQVGDLLEAVTEAGATTIGQIIFGLADPEQANRLARAEAVRNARARAEELAAAVDVTLGPVITISDLTYAPDAPIQAFAQTRALRAAPPIQTGETGVGATVTITYALLFD